MALKRAGADPLINQVLKDTYRITDFLGHDASSRQYGGEHLRLHKPIVVRVITADLPGVEELIARFRKEAILQAMVNHPMAVQTIDLDQTDEGQLYIVSEQAPGESLDQLLARERRLPVERAIGIACQALEILAVAHEGRIVHGDLRASSLMVETRGERDDVRIMDFGISALMATDERTRRALGVPYYLAPEVAAGEKPDARSDIYSVGVIIYQAITGKLPIYEPSLDRFYVKLLNEYPPRFKDAYAELEVPKHIEDAVFACLSKDPNNRAASALEIAQVLAGVETKRTRSFLLIAAASVLIAGGGIAFLMTRGGGDSGTTEAEAAAERARATAVVQHPRHSEAERLWQEAAAAKADGSEQAYELFDRARRAYLECIAYDATSEEAAAQARDRLGGRLAADHALMRAIDSTLAAAAKAKNEGNYPAAYAAFTSAATLASYDPGPEERARQAVASTTVTDHPSLGAARRLLEEADGILARATLVADDLRLAERRFTEAADEMAKAIPYDDTAEKAAEAARKTADTAHPRYTELVKLQGDAVLAKSRGDITEAIRLFTAARDGLNEIALKYDDAAEKAAEDARSRADPLNPLYAQGQARFDEGLAARGRGEYAMTYSMMREARELFARASAYDPALLESAREAKARAERTHPRFMDGETAFNEGLAKKDAGDHQAADAAFRKAIDFFAQAVPYDSAPERAASRAERRAWSGMPISYPAGKTAWDAGCAARDALDYAKAYEHFRTAEESFKLARFDPTLLDSLRESKGRAATSHPSYAEGERAEREAKAALDAGNGVTAEERYEAAISAYTQAVASGASAITSGTNPTTTPTSTADAEMRRARQAADRARKNAEEFKEPADQWHRQGEINRATQIHYDTATRLHGEAEAAMAAGNFVEAEAKFAEALESFKKVSNKSR